MKTTDEHTIAVEVHPAVKEFISTIVGTTVIEPIRNSDFYHKIVSFGESKNLRKKGGKYRFGTYETISLKINANFDNETILSKNMGSLIGQEIFESFRNTFVSYIMDAIRKGVEHETDAIRDFCTIYGICTSPKTLKTLKNVWYRSKKRNEQTVLC